MQKCQTMVAAMLVLAAAQVTHAAERTYGTITGWGQMVDPDGDCAFKVTQDALTIEIGTELHGLEAQSKRMNAPRVVQSVKGDFSIQVSVAGDLPLPATAGTKNTAYVSGGLLLMQDSDNYVRLERASFSRAGSEYHYANFEMWRDGRSVRMGQFADFPVDRDQTVVLRLEAKGDAVRALIKYENVPWHELGTAEIKRDSESLVGTHALNTSKQPVSLQFRKLLLDRAYVPVEADSRSRIALKEAAKALPLPNVNDPAFIKFMSAIRELQERAKTVRDMTEEQRSQLVDNAIKTIKDGPGNVSSLSLSIARGLSQSFEQASQYDWATQVYRQFAKSLKPVAGSEIADRLNKMADELAEKLAVIGTPMELEGQFMDGSKLKWDEYRGNVVLVDFWASWCGPCRREMPNVVEHYNQYQDRGFKVLGVCIDTDREKAETAITELEMPWPSLFEDDAGWNNASATRYNVRAIPAAFLVDRDGKILSLSARGETLKEMLEELFPDAE